MVLVVTAVFLHILSFSLSPSLSLSLSFSVSVVLSIRVMGFAVSGVLASESVEHVVERLCQEASSNQS